MTDNLYDSRVEMFLNAIQGRSSENIPVYLMMDALYAVQMNGKNLKEATYNPQLVLDGTKKLFEKVYCDGVGNIYTKGAIFYKLMRSKNFVQSEEGFLQHPEIYTLENDELDELIADPFKTIAEKVLPRTLGAMDEPFPKNMYNLMKANIGNSNYLGGLVGGKFALSHKMNVPMVYTNLTKAPFDYLGSSVRGFVNILADVRRTPQKLKDACEALLPLMEATAELSFRAPDKSFPFVFLPTLIPHFLQAKQFEMLFYPTFKQLLDNLAAKGFNFVIQFEGDWERFYDCLQSLPPKRILGIFEFGDPALAKKRLGDLMAISGFYPLSLLGMGTEEQCIDKAKEIIDVLAPGGGYVFSTDKQLLVLRDAKPQNLIAVHEFVHNYSI